MTVFFALISDCKLCRLELLNWSINFFYSTSNLFSLPKEVQWQNSCGFSFVCELE